MFLINNIFLENREVQYLTELYDNISSSIINESTIINGIYYHISNSRDLKILTPRIPLGVVAQKYPLEDKITPRVSFAPSISQCITGLTTKSGIFTGGEDLMYVYINEKTFKGIDNETIIKYKAVFDANITQEVWGIEPVGIKLIGMLKVYENIEKIIEFYPLLPNDFKPKHCKFIDSNGKMKAYFRKYIFIPNKLD